MKKADQFMSALLCGSLALGVWAAPLRAQTENQLVSVGAAALATPEELSEQEVIRRKEQHIRGKKLLEDAEAAMKAGKFDDAADAYSKALRILPKGPVAAKEIAAAKSGVINAYINKGKASIRSKNYEDARKAADEVLKLDPANGAAKSIIKTAERAPAPTPEKGAKTAAAAPADLDTVPRTIPPVDETPAFRKAQNQTTQLLRDARLAFQSNQLDLAAEKINSAMALDRYNEEARLLLRQVNEQRYHTAQVDMARVRSQYSAELLESWAPPVKPPRTVAKVVGSQTTVISPEKEKLEQKLNTIRLPKIEFREANIVDVVNFLAEQSRLIDQKQGGTGVNIVFAGGLASAGAGAAPAAPEAAAPAPAAPLPAPAPAPAAAPVPGAVPGAPGAPAPAMPEPVPAPAPAAMPAAPAAAPASAPMTGTPAITLNLLDVPLRDALRYVTDIAGLKFVVDKYAVLIVPMNYQPPGVMVTRDFQVPPGIFTTVMTGGAAAAAPPGGAAPAPAGPAPAPATAGGGTGVTSEDIKKFFTDAGVKFDQGASVTYQAATSRLFVTNTQENLDTIESILNTLRRAGGTQVTIEAKFIEIQQTDLRELGFDWVMGDWGFGSIHGSDSSVNPAFSLGGASGMTTFSPSFPDYTGDQGSATRKVTQGNRFASQAGTLSGNKLDSLLSGGTVTSSTVNDAVARMTGLLTNPQFQVILRALSQRKNVDLLCAPKVTTISGQQAKIEVVREFIYPTEFEPPRVATGGGSGGGNVPMISPPTPGGFQTRNLGVTLNVTPQIGETGLINLTLIPEVSDFDGFIDYGSRTLAGSGSQSQNLNALDFPFPQPVFSTRRVTTSVMVFDGSTVVLGGLMREDATKVQDKVPFLGDLPLLGKLFRNELENNIKKNLMVFVTARLIDPYGDLITPPTPATPVETVPVAPAAPAAAAAPRP